MLGQRTLRLALLSRLLVDSEESSRPNTARECLEVIPVCCEVHIHVRCSCPWLWHDLFIYPTRIRHMLLANIDVDDRWRSAAIFCWYRHCQPEECVFRLKTRHFYGKIAGKARAAATIRQCVSAMDNNGSLKHFYTGQIKYTDKTF